MTPSFSLLVAEDDEMDILLLERAFVQAGFAQHMDVVKTGEDAIAFLSRPRTPPNDRLPSLVLLDVQMPRGTGIDVLEWMRSRPVYRTVPVVMFSSSAHPSDVEHAYALGANAYLVKPPSTAERAEVARFLKEWLRLNQLPMASAIGLHAAERVHAAGKAKRPAVQ